MSPEAERDRALYLEGLDAFEAGRYFESHEHLEDLWLRNRSELRPFLQGLIQLAAAFVHLDAGRHRPTIALLNAAEARLAPFEPAALGVDVAHLLVATRAARVHAEDLGPQRLTEFDRARRVSLRRHPLAPEEFFPHRGTHPHPRR
jgi:predicted metal-dependent hydrolase